MRPQTSHAQKRMPSYKPGTSTPAVVSLLSCSQGNSKRIACLRAASSLTAGLDLGRLLGRYAGREGARRVPGAGLLVPARHDVALVDVLVIHGYSSGSFQPPSR